MKKVKARITYFVLLTEDDFTEDDGIVTFEITENSKRECRLAVLQPVFVKDAQFDRVRDYKSFLIFNPENPDQKTLEIDLGDDDAEDEVPVSKIEKYLQKHYPKMDGETVEVIARTVSNFRYLSLFSQYDISISHNGRVFADSIDSPDVNTIEMEIADFEKIDFDKPLVAQYTEYVDASVSDDIRRTSDGREPKPSDFREELIKQDQEPIVPETELILVGSMKRLNMKCFCLDLSFGTIKEM